MTAARSLPRYGGALASGSATARLPPGGTTNRGRQAPCPSSTSFGKRESRGQPRP
jgi:hypothetical protein